MMLSVIAKCAPNVLKNEMGREAERVKEELKHLRKERESIAEREEAKRAAAEVARLQREADALAEARK